MADFDHIFVGGGRLKPNPKMHCERCAFGSGEHAQFCRFGKVREAQRAKVATRRLAALAGLQITRGD